MATRNIPRHLPFVFAHALMFIGLAVMIGSAFFTMTRGDARSLPGPALDRDGFVQALETGRVKAIAAVDDLQGDVVVRLADESLAVFPNANFVKLPDLAAAVDLNAFFVAGRGDAGLAARAAEIASIKPDPANFAPMLAGGVAAAAALVLITLLEMRKPAPPAPGIVAGVARS